MRKIEFSYRAYPSALECEGGVANRVHTIMPTPWEVAFLSKELKIPNSGIESLKSMIVSIFEDDSGALYFAFGCCFFDKKAENERILKKDIKMLDYVNKTAKNFTSEGIHFKRSYYFNVAINIIKRLNSVLGKV